MDYLWCVSCHISVSYRIQIEICIKDMKSFSFSNISLDSLSTCSFTICLFFPNPFEFLDILWIYFKSNFQIKMEIANFPPSWCIARLHQIYLWLTILVFSIKQPHKNHFKSHPLSGTFWENLQQASMKMQGNLHVYVDFMWERSE